MQKTVGKMVHFFFCELNAVFTHFCKDLLLNLLSKSKSFESDVIFSSTLKPISFNKKMTTVKKILIFFVVCLIICTQSHISIDIDATELQSIGEVLVESYFHHNLIQRRISVPRTILSTAIKVLISVLQFIGVTGSLIAANIFTPWFQSSPTTITPTNVNNIKTNEQYNTAIVPSKICPHDFGCDRNVCWRSCHTNEKETNVKSWCYTRLNLKSNDYVECAHPHDCSPCWECLGVCHIEKKINVGMYWNAFV